MIPELLLGLLITGLPSTEATVVFAGDAMQHQRQIDAARDRAGNYDYSQCFEDIKSWVSDADYAVVNLETPVGDSNFSGYPCFNAPRSFAEALGDAGFDMLLTANNHTLDRREGGLRKTVSVLDSLGLDHIGTYTNSAARDSIIPFIRDIGGYRIGFLNYTYGTNGFKVRDDAVVDLIDKDLIVRDIESTRRAGAELVAIIIHWGVEYVLLPPPEVRKLADFLCSQDVDMVIGGHPHVIQPMELRHNERTGRPVLLVYSLGNFISAMRTRDTRGGAMVKAHIMRDILGRPFVSSAEYMPHFTVPGNSPRDNFRVVLLPDENRLDSVVPPAWRANAKAWMNASSKIFNSHNKNVTRARSAESR